MESTTGKCSPVLNDQRAKNRDTGTALEVPSTKRKNFPNSSMSYTLGIYRHPRRPMNIHELLSVNFEFSSPAIYAREFFSFLV